MATWQPQQAGLQEILQTIHKSTDTTSSGVQTQVTHVRRSFSLDRVSQLIPAHFIPFPHNRFPSFLEIK